MTLSLFEMETHALSQSYTVWLASLSTQRLWLFDDAKPKNEILANVSRLTAALKSNSYFLG